MHTQAEANPEPTPDALEQRHDRVLAALALAAARLLQFRGEDGTLPGTALPPVLARLGHALGVSRVYVLELVAARKDEHRDTQARPLSAWTDPEPGLPPASGVAAGLEFSRGPASRWLREFRRGGCVVAPAAALPADEAAVLEAGGVRATALQPLLVGGRLWGILGMDECRRERAWRQSELDALRTLAGILAGALGRDQIGGDATQATELLRELAYRASHDALTGLPNREDFERQLDHLVQDAEANGTAHALCYLDLDQFKLVNDSCGHAAGDALLKGVATTLREALDEGDVVARLGGDEFGVLMPRHDTWEAARKAQALVDALARMRFEWGERQFTIGGSVGVAPVTREAGSRAAVLVAADAACYVAKERGRNRVHVLEPSDVELARRQGEMRWVPRLQTALEVGDFHLQAHAIVPTFDQRPGLRHLEVLLALPGASGRLVPPGEFLPAAQRYGLMGRIDRWVVAQVADWLGRREAAGLAELALVAVNLSGSSLGDPEFRDFVEEQVRLLHAPQQLCFEITESEAVANLAEAADFIRRMKEFGCRFALDDFGSGLTSFAYLKRLPVDFVKIDGQFVREMGHDPVNMAMVEAIHRIGKVMGLRTVAEFVETPAIFEAVRRIGVDYCQGFHFGRPVPLSALD